MPTIDFPVTSDPAACAIGIEENTAGTVPLQAIGGSFRITWVKPGVQKGIPVEQFLLFDGTEHDGIRIFAAARHFFQYALGRPLHERVLR